MTPKTRSLGGCSTCRRAHVKCDETRPTCLACEKQGVVCGGYETRITFTFEWCDSGPQQQGTQGSDEHGGTLKYRRPLFTNVYCRSMSESLVASVPPYAAADVLSLLDSESTQVQDATSDKTEVRRGPFGVLKLLPTPQVEETSPSATTQSMPETFLSNDGIDAILYDLQMSFPPDYPAEVFPTALNESPGDEMLFFEDIDPPSHSLMSSIETTTELEVQRMLTNPTAFSTLGTSLPLSQVPPDSAALLYHYQDSVTLFLSPTKCKKTPWHVLFVPNSMNSLAGLSMGLVPNNANLCTFYALLSTSAFHLSALTSEHQNEHWEARADHYLELARQALQRSREGQSSVFKREKYKERLMAVLAMYTASAFGGHWRLARRYLLEADILIRQNGLPKPYKSRRVRLLHHYYTYSRIIHEATFITAPGRENCNANDSGTTGEELEQSPLRARPWDGRLDQRLSMDKSLTIGQNDLLLAIPGRWELTLYPSIYGVNESFLVLLSETTRLANERHILQKSPGQSSLTWPQYLLRAKVLEKCICCWEAEADHHLHSLSTSVSPPLLRENSELLAQMMSALYQALLIYFYRRIHDVSPRILQNQVQKAIELLLRCEKIDATASRCAATFAWTGFIAGCEALGEEDQDKFSAWFRRSSQRSGIKTFASAHHLVEQVWQQRRELDDVGGSWLKLVQNQQDHLCYI